MPDLYDYLLRFRRLLIPPGAPGQRERMPLEPARLEDELQEILDAIDEVDATREELTAAASAEAEQLRADTDEACTQRMDEARRQADEAYDAAYQARSEELGARFDALLDEARAEARRIEDEGDAAARDLGRSIATAILEGAQAESASGERVS
jgi:flagellar biosynthesis/type III secretory pathway protein FliH